MRVLISIFLVSFMNLSLLHATPGACIRYFTNPNLFFVHQKNIQIALSFYDRVMGLKSYQFLNGTMPRTAQKILEQLKIDVAEMVVANQSAVTFEGITQAAEATYYLDRVLKAALGTASVANTKILEVYKERIESIEEERLRPLLDQIAGAPMPRLLYRHLKHFSDEMNISFEKVLEKWNQLNAVLQRTYQHPVHDYALMYFLTRFAVLTRNVGNVARAYFSSFYASKRNFPDLPESLKMTVLFTYMHNTINFNIEETYNVYMQLHNELQKPKIEVPAFKLSTQIGLL